MVAEPIVEGQSTLTLILIACATVLEQIFDRFLADLGWFLDPKILQNCVRGVRKLALRMYTLDADPMSFRTQNFHNLLLIVCPGRV